VKPIEAICISANATYIHRWYASCNEKLCDECLGRFKCYTSDVFIVDMSDMYIINPFTIDTNNILNIVEKQLFGCHKGIVMLDYVKEHNDNNVSYTVV
jgi:hypothetical protein